MFFYQLNNARGGIFVMANQEKRQRLYDVKEYKEKIVTALENLKQTEQPGEVSGKATKTEVLKSVTAEIEALIKQGYTLKQIANAISGKDIRHYAKNPYTIVSGKNYPGNRQKKKDQGVDSFC